MDCVGELVGVREKDGLGAVVEDVGKELSRMGIVRFREGCGDSDGDRRSTGATRGRGGSVEMSWREGRNRLPSIREEMPGVVPTRTRGPRQSVGDRPKEPATAAAAAWGRRLCRAEAS